MVKLKKYLFLLGITIIVVGFLYDILFAGIPPQDPPTQLMEKHNQNAFISDVILKLGLLIMIIGIVFKIPHLNKNK